MSDRLGPWTVLSETPLVKNRWIDARVEHCRTPTGAESRDYTVLHYPDWSTAIALTPDRRFVMTRQWRQGAQSLSLECAGGVVDAGETPAEAAARELMEETGYRGTEAGPVLSVNPNPAIQRNRFHAVLFTDCVFVAKPVAQGTERLEVFLMSGAEILTAIRSGELIHALQVAVLMTLFSDRPALLESPR